jgi:hypothetical protein
MYAFGPNAEDPKVFTVEIKLDVFSVVNPVTVDVSCGREIYLEVPSPVRVDVCATKFVAVSVVSLF